MSLLLYLWWERNWERIPSNYQIKSVWEMEEQTSSASLRREVRKVYGTQMAFSIGKEENYSTVCNTGHLYYLNKLLENIYTRIINRFGTRRMPEASGPVKNVYYALNLLAREKYAGPLTESTISRGKFSFVL